MPSIYFFQTYLWNGRVLNIPCSHGAHLENNQRGYRSGWKQSVLNNYKRVVEVWFDEYRERVYYYNDNIKVQIMNYTLQSNA